MRQKHLESALSSVQREFPDPKITLEQYPTSPVLTASVVLTALANQDVGPGRSVLDLGCGTGMLALGCALVDTDFVMGVDCDATALQVALQNVVDMELDDRVVLVRARVKNNQSSSSSSTSRQQSKQQRGGFKRGRHSSSDRNPNKNQHSTAAAVSSVDVTSADNDDSLFPLRDKCVDTVVTNPPFGTKHNAGMDIQFLKTATRLARRAVYSFHKTSTRDFIRRTVEQTWGLASFEVVAEMKFDLPKVYKFHKEKSVDVQVDLIRVITETESATAMSLPREISDSCRHDEQQDNDDDHNNQEKDGGDSLD